MTIDDSHDHQLGSLAASVQSLKETMRDCTKRVDDHLDKQDQRLGAVEQDVKTLLADRPRTGELHILGRRWSRAQAAVLVALVGVLGWVGVELHQTVTSNSRAIASLVPIVERLQQESDKGGRYTSQDAARDSEKIHDAIEKLTKALEERDE